jgi:hypothetical protein
VLRLLVPLAAAACEIEQSGPADAGGAQLAATLLAPSSGVDAAITSDERQRVRTRGRRAGGRARREPG